MTFRRGVRTCAVACVCIAGAVAARPSGAQSAVSPQGTAPPRTSLRVEFRERVETLRGIGFAGNSNDTFWLSRLRVSLAARPAQWLRMLAQVQDARVADKTVGSVGSPWSAPVDLRIGQVELGHSTSPLVVTLGRQELAFGEQRLIGHGNWTNAARVFDAARLTIGRRALRMDAFAASVVRVLADDWDRSGFGNHLYGIYGSMAGVVPAGTVEPYFLWREEGAGATRLELGTTGLRVAGRIGRNSDYDVESVVQRGTAGSNSVATRAQHVRVRTAVHERLRVSGEYNYASGDGAAQDGRHETFDPLYPTAHDKYGLADQFGWRNLHHARAALDITAGQLPVTFAYHSWWLASPRDAVYNVAGTAFVPVTDNALGRHIGHGLDVQASRTFARRVTVTGGYSCTLPGTVLRAATRAARTHSAHLMVTVSALVEH